MSNATNATDTFIPNYDSCDQVSDLCPVEATIYGSYFTKSSCIWLTSLYALCIVTQCYFAWRSKAWSFGVWLGIGSLAECIGYAARIIMCGNPWSFNAFLVQNMMLVLGPTFIAASISIVFKHLIEWHGSEWSIVRPAFLPWLLIGTDLISIGVQGTGGALSSIGSGQDDGQALLDAGNSLLLGGTIFQVVNMVFCGCLMLHYVWRRRQSLDHFRFRLRSSYDGGDQAKDSQCVAANDFEPTLKVFIYALATAYIAILVRCVYRYVSNIKSILPQLTVDRIPEMAAGWASDIMKTESIFLTFEGYMMLISVFILTVFHPWVFFPVIGNNGNGKAREASSHEMADMSQNVLLR